MPAFKILTMKIFLLLSFFFSSSLLLAQDTLYLDSDYNKVLREDAEYFQIDYWNGSGEQDLNRKTFWKNGILKSERNFLSKNGKLIPHGISKFWYENGQLYYSQNYKKGERHGELLAFWEDGTPRRQDYFKNGKLKSGTVWDKSGKKVEHFPVLIPAMFPGGQQAIQAYLKKHLPVNPVQKNGTEVRVVVSIRIDKVGDINEVEIIEGAPHWYNAVTINALTKMPRWNPGMHMGEPINVRYTLPVIFRK